MAAVLMRVLVAAVLATALLTALVSAQVPVVVNTWPWPRAIFFPLLQ